MKGEPLELLTDEQLVSLTRSGNQDAFNRLASRWEGSLYRFVRRTIGNSEDARDVCQEALIKAYQNVDRLREGAKFKPWLHHIALNICRDRFRSAKTKGDSFSIDDAKPAELSNEGIQESTEHGAITGDIGELLGSFLDTLPMEQKTCLLLREYHGFNSEEISEITGVPPGTVRTRIFYGLKAVRKKMSQRGLSVSDFQ
ncbi:MAG: RNA polymerase sigma factor [Candidatus Eisenbacteria bacterium]|uniref:RNA polymerase sigma factor n=1 Tax=Eiseniibacteriota bacterium TaxID=2212470 RepID=A0A7Y2H279_UNCEI|nr:RNA polymerase sigma factor [Candidatus Eisenbacteria bacterium]